ncbi:MAG: hypothetical protein ACM30G_04285 [Micromonosporaceae bacterium]
MRRQVMAVSVGAVCVAVLAACAGSPSGAGASATSPPAPSASPTAHPNFPACRAVSDSRIGILNAVVRADLVLNDPASSTQEITAAGGELADAFSEAGAKMTDAAGKTSDAGLTAAITEMSAAAADLAAAARAAGGARDKLAAAEHSDAFDAAEKKMLAVCRGVLT